MKNNNKDLSSLICRGNAKINLSNDELSIWSTYSTNSIDSLTANSYYKKNSVILPNKYKLPFKINITVKLDFPTLIMLIGDGYLTFNSFDNNRKIEDIVKPSGKPNQDRCLYNDKFEFDKFINISIIYNFKEMQVVIDGEERFYSTKLPYMKSKNLNTINEEGFEIGFIVSKLSKAIINSLSVIESEKEVEITRGNFVETIITTNQVIEKPTFETIIYQLPHKYIDELIKIDSFIKSLKPLSFKRSLDKNGHKITYISSEYGMSYIIYIKDGYLTHSLSFYIVTAGKPDTWHRKADYMEELLCNIAKNDTPFANRIFNAFSNCVGCYSAGCLAKTLYSFNNEKRLTCHGRVLFRQCDDDFRDVKAFLSYFNKFIEDKIKNNSLVTGKIYLIK